jgi:hypothetical protein
MLEVQHNNYCSITTPEEPSIFSRFQFFGSNWDHDYLNEEKVRWSYLLFSEIPQISNSKYSTVSALFVGS